jgi:hypothetical protein
VRKARGVILPPCTSSPPHTELPGVDRVDVEALAEVEVDEHVDVIG